MAKLALLGLFNLFWSVWGLNNGLGRLPIMGWTTGKRFDCLVDCINYHDDCISQQLIRTMADVLTLTSFRKAGYNYVILGDCWMDLRRDSKGRLAGDRERFSNGMFNLINYLHKKNLKVGVTIDLGNSTCNGYPGSYKSYDVDIKTLSDWGVDLVVATSCGVDDYTLIADVYIEFGKQLNKTYRPIVYVCQWAVDQAKKGGQTDYELLSNTCNYFKINADVVETAEGLSKTLQFYAGYQYLFRNYSGPGSYQDPDQLFVGGYGLSSDLEQFQMALWAVLAAPLVMSTDLRKIEASSKKILLNKRLISINQDAAGTMGWEKSVNNQVHIWTKPVAPSTSMAVALFYTNVFGLASETSFVLSSLGIVGSPYYNVTEIFSGVNYGVYKPWHTLNCEVTPSATLLFIFEAIDFV